MSTSFPSPGAPASGTACFEPPVSAVPEVGAPHRLTGTNREHAWSWLSTGLIALLLTCAGAHAQSVADYAVRLNAVVQPSPPRITLLWLGDPNATNYSVSRKSRDATSWGAPVTLPGDATNYVDTAVAVGTGYEYRVVKSAMSASAFYTGEGYLYSGIEVPLTDARGKVILIVDSSHASALAVELARLQRDLLGDGWTVARHDVARTDSVTSVAGLIKADYNADPSRVKVVFLLGHIPVPYSGELNPDGHSDHRGAWPADAYYGDMNGIWTDATVNNVTASSSRNRNIAGDGKFDQSLIPSNLELQVGRVDLANLPSFAEPEVELLRRYLNKDHAFRHRQFTVERRGLIDDNFGVFSGEAFAVNGWRNFAALCGPTNSVAGDWKATLRTQGYLMGFGCGSGTYTSAGDVISTSDLASGELRAVFTLLFGSYFGDWDSSDNLLRAMLASSPYALTSAWAGRPHWHLHHMGLGETIGFSARVTQNNSSLYLFNYGARAVHVALMGDPTLRLNAVAPPSALVVQSNQGGGVKLSWNRSPDGVAGYLVYRSTTANGPFSRLNATSLVTTNEYVDATGSTQIYMVRAVMLEVGPSGSYYNPSQGVFQDRAGSFGPPRLAIDRTGAVTSVSWPLNMLGYHLESSPLLQPPAWQECNLSLRTNNQRIIALPPATTGTLFLRVREP